MSQLHQVFAHEDDQGIFVIVPPQLGINEGDEFDLVQHPDGEIV